MNSQKNRPIGQQDLPEPAEVEVLEALQAEPVRRGALEHAVDAEVRADQRAEHHDGQRAEQREGQRALMLRLAPGDHRREEDPGRHERRRHPEDRELDVPGAHEVVGEHAAPGRSRRSRRCRRGSAGCAAPTSVWIRNSAAITKKNHAQARCAGVSATSPGERNESVACSRPCQPEQAPATEDAEQDPDPAQQRDQREHAPDDDVRGRLVGDERLRRPVVGVGVVVARARVGRRPTPTSRRTRSAGGARCGR